MFKKSIMDLDIKDYINYLPEHGKIFLDDRRMIFYDTQSLGLLRRDLIHSLGFERARAFMFRFGWNRGYHDTKTINRYKYESDCEWIKAGPRMHQMQGFAKIDVDQVHVDSHAGTFFMQGTWKDSYEAEEYLKNFKKSHFPVCSIMTGYASGFASANFPKQVIFKEEKCIAKGDPICVWVGKTVEEWGCEVEEELSYFHGFNMFNPEDQIYQEIEKQKYTLQVTNAIHRKLMKNAIRGGGLDEICSILSELLDVPVIIESEGSVLMSFAGLSEELAIQYTASVAKLAEDPGSSPQYRYLSTKLKSENVPVELKLPDHRRLMAAIPLKDELFGYISIVTDNEQDFDTHLLCLERASWACAITLLQEKTAIETQQRLAGKFLDEILSYPQDRGKIIKQGKILGYNLAQPGYVFLLQPENPRNIFDHTEKYIHQLQHYFEEEGQKCLVAEKASHLVILIPKSYLDRKNLTIYTMAEKIMRLLKSKSDALEMTWSMGISNPYQEVSKVGKAYEEASQALELRKLQSDKETIIAFEKLGVFRILLKHGSPEVLRMFAEEKLGALLKYDRETNNELTKTLYLYIFNECNMQKTAEEMKLSLSGFRYRLRRIMELYNGDLTTAEERFQVYFALKYFIMMKELEI